MAAKTRVGTACWYMMDGKWLGGRLLCWGHDSEICDDGVLTFPVGVIEDDASCRCVSVYVNEICFGTIPPSD